VIARVLRPGKTARALGAAGGVDAQPAQSMLRPSYDENGDAEREVSAAYEQVKEVDCLDLTKEGDESLEAALRRYDERIDRVEARITAQLRDQLGEAKNANQMFQIFSRYNALFIRPHIRGAIREYQTQLIQRVKQDIGELQVCV